MTLQLADPKCPTHHIEANCICLDSNCPNCPIRLCPACIVSADHLNTSLIYKLNQEIQVLIDSVSKDKEIAQIKTGLMEIGKNMPRRVDRLRLQSFVMMERDRYCGWMEGYKKSIRTQCGLYSGRSVEIVEKLSALKMGGKLQQGYWKSETELVELDRMIGEGMSIAVGWFKFEDQYQKREGWKIGESQSLKKMREIIESEKRRAISKIENKENKLAIHNDGYKHKAI